jgi:hypothetical protein
MIDVNMGEEDVVEAFHPQATQFGKESWDGRKRAGIDEEGSLLPPNEPGADELTESLEGRLVEIDADWSGVFHEEILVTKYTIQRYVGLG